MRKVVQIATEAGWFYDDPATRQRKVMAGALHALCDDGTIWRLQFRDDGKPVKWVQTMPVPQDMHPSEVQPDPSRARDEVTERSREEFRREFFGDWTAKS